MIEVPKEFVEPPLKILFESFVWNSCSINFSSLQFDIKSIREWYMKWIQPGEKNFETKTIGVIHSLSVQSEKTDREIRIDFGSAPVDAAVELFITEDTNN